MFWLEPKVLSITQIIPQEKLSTIFKIVTSSRKYKGSWKKKINNTPKQQGFDFI